MDIIILVKKERELKQDFDIKVMNKINLKASINLGELISINLKNYLFKRKPNF